MPNIDDLLADEGAALLRTAGEVRTTLARHAVPLYFFRDTPDPSNYVGQGSGVLVKILSRYFILTAGHCISAAGSGKIVVGVLSRTHCFVPALCRNAYRCDYGTEHDFGFWEVPAVDASTIKLTDRIFLSETQIAILTHNECMARDDWMILGGYPGEIAVGQTGVKPGARLLAYSTILSGTREAPVSTIGRVHNGHHVVDLWVPKTGNLESTVSPPEPISIPSLSGASGGGCWLTGLKGKGAAWLPQDMQLVGIHSGSCAEVVINNERHVFAREILLGHHLNLIAHEYEDLRQHVASLWPSINEFPIEISP